MRLCIERERRGWLGRVFGKEGEIAYLELALLGLCAEIEFPSDWHEHQRAWVRLGFGIFRIAFSFPWRWVVPDEYQCSGPTYGFTFFDDGLQLHWGKCKGKRDDPMMIIGMPWRWHQRKHKVLSSPESYPYYYVMRSGEVQERTATIKAESRLWMRPWIPFRRLSRYIDNTAESHDEFAKSNRDAERYRWLIDESQWGDAESHRGAHHCGLRFLQSPIRDVSLHRSGVLGTASVMYLWMPPGMGQDYSGAPQRIRRNTGLPYCALRGLTHGDV